MFFYEACIRNSFFPIFGSTKFLASIIKLLEKWNDFERKLRKIILKLADKHSSYRRIKSTMPTSLQQQLVPPFSNIPTALPLSP